MKVKLTDKQLEKLRQAVGKEKAYEEQARISNQLFKDAQKARMDVVDMIADAHQVDLKKTTGAFNLTNDGYLVFQHNGNGVREAISKAPKKATKKAK